MATRHVSMRPAEHGHRERYLDAALSVLFDRGVTALTVRGVAEAAGASTISVYTRFGGRSGLLDALYERTFDSLRELLEACRRRAPTASRTCCTSHSSTGSSPAKARSATR